MLSSKLSIFRKNLKIQVHSLPPPAPKFEESLSPSLFMPLVSELFKNLNQFVPKHSISLTGSTARKIQNKKLENPSDIDILLGEKDDLDEGAALLEHSLSPITGLKLIYDNHQGILGVSYKEKNIKLHVIDFKSSHQCYPSDEINNARIKEGDITMIDAQYMPSKSFV